MAREKNYVGDVMYKMFRDVPDGSDTSSILESFLDEQRALLCVKDHLQDPDRKLFNEFVLRIQAHVRSLKPEALIRAAANTNKTVMAVVSGAEKAAAVDVLAKHRLINTLVIDRRLAHATLDIVRDRETADQ